MSVAKRSRELSGLDWKDLRSRVKEGLDPTKLGAGMGLQVQVLVQYALCKGLLAAVQHAGRDVGVQVATQLHLICKHCSMSVYVKQICYTLYYNCHIFLHLLHVKSLHHAGHDIVIGTATQVYLIGKHCSMSACVDQVSSALHNH